MIHTLTTGLHRFCEWVARLAYLNLLWITFSLIGIIIFGVMPATTAMFSIVRRWLRGDTEFPLFQSFLNIYRSEFLKTNLLGLILAVTLVIFYLDFYILEVVDGQNIIIKLIFTTLLLIFGVILLYVFPVYVHYNLSVPQTFKYAFIIGFSRPFYTLSMFIGAVSITYLMFLHITFIIFFSGSIFAFVMSWFAHKAFNRIEIIRGNQNKVDTITSP